MLIKKIVLVGVFSLGSAGMVAQAQAAGCVKGAAAGGVGGHFVGSGHAVAGAVAGCAVGHHMAKKNEEKAAAEQNQPAPAK